MGVSSSKDMIIAVMHWIPQSLLIRGFTAIRPP